jgi:chromate transporter
MAQDPMNDDSPLGALTWNFLVLSFFTIGGINAALPEMHRQVVEVHGWMSDQRFADLFALAQASPGPNLIVVPLIGWQVAGMMGALLSTVAVTAPTSVLAYLMGGIWHRYRTAHWRRAIQSGLAPITIGLVASSAFVIGMSVDRNLVALAITLVSAIFLYRTRIHPLVFLGAGAALGAAGLI